MATVTISERAYQHLLTLAQKQGQTPEEVLEALLEIEDDPGQVYDNLDDFFRSLGLSQEAIDRVISLPELEDESSCPNLAQKSGDVRRTQEASPIKKRIQPKR